MAPKDRTDPAEPLSPESRADALRPAFVLPAAPELQERLTEDSGADPAQVIHWLDSGEGNPWPVGS